MAESVVLQSVAVRVTRAPAGLNSLYTLRTDYVLIFCRTAGAGTLLQAIPVSLAPTRYSTQRCYWRLVSQPT